MSNVTRLVAVLAVLCLAFTAFAQGGGQGRGQGQGRGGFGGGQGRGGFGMGMQGGMGGAFLLNDANVQADLALTAEQKTKLEAVQRKAREEMSAMRENMVGQDRDAMMQAMRKINENSQKEINAILTADQQKRLKEISLQVAGNRAVMQEDVQKDLALTDAQKQKLRELQENQMQANQALFQRVRNQEISREEFQAAQRKNEEIMNVEISKVLTAEQNAKLKAMQGTKPFKGLAQQPGGRGGRGGGGF
ncbi:MAG TPA: hypothetical protein VM328_08095 [Fimbriimonadaceae bacterium]|nr:hypothetical protein [Fimbriimonadaceae bacterium]